MICVSDEILIVKRACKEWVRCNLFPAGSSSRRPDIKLGMVSFSIYFQQCNIQGNGLESGVKFMIGTDIKHETSRLGCKYRIIQNKMFIKSLLLKCTVDSLSFGHLRIEPPAELKNGRTNRWYTVQRDHFHCRKRTFIRYVRNWRVSFSLRWLNVEFESRTKRCRTKESLQYINVHLNKTKLI